MPKFAAFFMVFMLASVGLPGTSGFVGEFMVLIGTFQVNTWVALFATTGVILGATYMLYMYRRVVFGKLTKDDVKLMPDLGLREVAIFVPMVLIVIWMGIYPSSFTDITDASVTNLIDNYQQALTEADSVDVAGQ
jgi:NADH-quinone oxidoreductase subunit M